MGLKGEGQDACLADPQLCDELADVLSGAEGGRESGHWVSESASFEGLSGGTGGRYVRGREGGNEKVWRGKGRRGGRGRKGEGKGREGREGGKGGERERERKGEGKEGGLKCDL